MQQHDCPHCEPFDVLAEKVERISMKMTMLWGPNGTSEPAKNSIIDVLQKNAADDRTLFKRLFIVAILVECLNLLGGNANGLVRIIQAIK